MFEIQKRDPQGIKKWYRIKDELMFDPSYQRDSDIWPASKKKLLIDSILNKFDLPKFYFHDLMFGFIPNKAVEKTKKRYAIVDGKQRLQALFSFIDGEFPLSEDFELQRKPSLSEQMRGKYYNELKSEFSEEMEDFDGFSLDVAYILTDESDKIDELFLRLNEGTPVNSQEKRLAKSENYRKLVRDIVKDSSFASIVGFKDLRQAYSEVATKLLLLESVGEVTDLKKTYLDEFALKVGKSDSKYLPKAKVVISSLKKLKKALGIIKLKSRGVVPVYYLFYKEVSKENTYSDLKFKKFILKFEKLVETTKEALHKDLSNKIDSRIVEYNRLNQQGTNDAGSILGRIQILTHYYKEFRK
jgi:hypothetical protein